MDVKKAVKVEFYGRSTGMGAYTRYRVFSLRQRKELDPHMTEYSRTGRHWTDIWWLLPGRYFICWTDISNSGKHRCSYGCLLVEDGKYRIEEWQGAPPDFAEWAICDCLIGCKMPEY